MKELYFDRWIQNSCLLFFKFVLNLLVKGHLNGFHKFKMYIVIRNVNPEVVVLSDVLAELNFWNIISIIISFSLFELNLLLTCLKTVLMNYYFLEVTQIYIFCLDHWPRQQPLCRTYIAPLLKMMIISLAVLERWAASSVPSICQLQVLPVTIYGSNMKHNSSKAMPHFTFPLRCLNASQASIYFLFWCLVSRVIKSRI